MNEHISFSSRDVTGITGEGITGVVNLEIIQKISEKVYLVMDRDGRKYILKSGPEGVIQTEVMVQKRAGRNNPGVPEIAAIGTASLVRGSGTPEQLGGLSFLQKYIPAIPWRDPESSITQVNPRYKEELIKPGALELLAQILTGIHGSGVVHGDLKPANILIGKLRPHVIDFDASPPVQAAIPGKPVILATDGFIPPEAASASEDLRYRRVERVDHESLFTPNSDLYMLAVAILYIISDQLILYGDINFSMNTQYTRAHHHSLIEMLRMYHIKPDRWKKYSTDISKRIRSVFTGALSTNPLSRSQNRRNPIEKFIAELSDIIWGEKS
jgi:serine/threonine protein kinase